jgi:hypothetical protein
MARKTTPFGIRLGDGALEQLEAEADRRGISRAGLARQFIDAQLEEMRRAELERIRALSDRLAAEAKVLFAHLPAGEIEEDDPLYFTASPEGGLLLVDPLTGHHYRALEDGAVRLRLLGDQVELVVLQDGKELERRLVPVALAGMEPNEP